jgi:hypothetical protein
MQKKLSRPRIWKKRFKELYFQYSLALATLDLPILPLLEILDRTAPLLVANIMSIEPKWQVLKVVKDAWRKKTGLDKT